MHIYVYASTSGSAATASSAEPKQKRQRGQCKPSSSPDLALARAAAAAAGFATRQDSQDNGEGANAEGPMETEIPLVVPQNKHRDEQGYSLRGSNLVEATDNSINAMRRAARDNAAKESKERATLSQEVREVPEVAVEPVPEQATSFNCDIDALSVTSDNNEEAASAAKKACRSPTSTESYTPPEASSLHIKYSCSHACCQCVVDLQWVVSRTTKDGEPAPVPVLAKQPCARSTNAGKTPARKSAKAS